MKKLFSVFAEISILAAPVTYTIGCNPIPDLPYISDNQISENTKKTINSLVLDENSKVNTLFNYNLDTWVKPTFFPVNCTMKCSSLFAIIITSIK